MDSAIGVTETDCEHEGDSSIIALLKSCFDAEFGNQAPALGCCAWDLGRSSTCFCVYIDGRGLVSIGRAQEPSIGSFVCGLGLWVLGCCTTQPELWGISL